MTEGNATARQLLCGVSSGSHPTPLVTIQWHQANVSRAVRKPHDGDDCSEREGVGRGEGKTGGSEKRGSCIS